MNKFIDFLIYKHIFTLLCLSPLILLIDFPDKDNIFILLYVALWLIFLYYINLIRTKKKTQKISYYLFCFFTVYFVLATYCLNSSGGFPNPQVKDNLMFCSFNFIESVFWLICSCVFAWNVFYRNKSSKYKGTMIATSAFFLCFSISDILEMSTGAWWQPLSLLYFKLFCVWGLVSCYFSYLQVRSARASGVRH